MENIKITTEIQQETSFFYKETSTINLLDDILKARNELFENRLTQGVDAHKKLNDMVLPHQS